MSSKLLSSEHWEELSEKSLALFSRGRELAKENGLILVDTKYEFGLDENGVITVADEIHTPDSSRYWISDTYDERFTAGENPDSLDKEFLRLWVASKCDPYKDPIPEIPSETLIKFGEKYIQLYEIVTGQKFEKPSLSEPVKERIRRALISELPEYFR